MTQRSGFGRVLVAGLALTGAFGAAVTAQEAAPARPDAQPQAEPARQDLPSAVSLFERHIAALGGKDKVLAITSRTFTGTLRVYAAGQETPQQSGILRLQAKAPNLLIQEMIFPGVSTTQKFFDGKAGWTVEQNRPAAAMPPIELERFAVGARFYTEVEYEDHYKSYETIERKQTEGDTVFVVRVEYPSGRTESVFFSEKSGLIVGVAGVRSFGPDQQVEFLRSYDEYTDFGSGVLSAKRIREVIGNQMFEITFSSIETGTDFPAIVRPAGIPDADLSRYVKQ